MPDKSEISGIDVQDDAIKIRHAKPDLAEGLLFAQYFNEAAEGFFKSMLGEKTFEIIADAFVKSNNEYSFENAMAIEYEGKVVGMISGYLHTEKKAFTKNILSQFRGGSKFKIMMFNISGRILSLFIGPKGKADYYLQAIAVNNEIRGKGIGQRLLKHSEELAIKKGASTLSLDVSSKNERATKSYQKFGMEAVSHWPNFLKLSPVFTRMEKKL